MAADLQGGSGHISFSFGPYLAQVWPEVLLGAAEFAAVGCLAGTVLGLAGGGLGRGAGGGCLRKIVGRLGAQLSTWTEPQG